MTYIEHARQPRRIQSIDVGFQVVRVLERSGGKMPLKHIAAEAGMSPSKVYLYLSSFMALGLVAQDDVTGHYGLGSYAVQLGLAAIGQLNIVDASKLPLQELHSATGQSAYLSIWGNMGPVILLKFDSDLNAPVGIKVGSVLPLLRSATGRVFLSYLPEADLRPVLERESAVETTRTGNRDEIVAEVRRRGIAFSDSQVYEGFAALSTPVFDHAGSLAGSITLLGLRRNVMLGSTKKMVGVIKDTASQVSTSLGFERR